MKKLLAITFLIFAALVAKGQDMNHWKVKEGNVLNHRAFVEAPVAMLDTVVPDSSLEYVYGTNYVSGTTFRDFVITVVESLDKTKVIVGLEARTTSYGRNAIISAEDLRQYIEPMTAAGFPTSTWLNKAEFFALRATEDYTQVEVD